MTSEWNNVDVLARALEARFGGAPVDVVAVLGSGLGCAVESLAHRDTALAGDLPAYPVSTVQGHAGRVHVGEASCRRVMLLEGRVHLYEGYSPVEVVRPVRAAVALGARAVVLTNAAGGINASLRPGALMLVEDHLNLTGQNPLVGPNDDERGPRFPDLTSIYDPELRRRIATAAGRLGIELAHGVYAGVLGPSYETPAEVRMLARLGADAVGMSTVLEAIAARHMGARVAALSCITNRAAGLPGALLDHDDVRRAAGRAAADLGRLLVAFFGALEEER